MLPHGEAGRRVRPPHCLAVSKSRHCAAGRAASTRLRHPHPAHRHPRRWLLLPLRQPDCGSVRSGPGGRRHLHRRAAAAGGLGAGHSRRRPSRVLRGALFSRAFDAFPRFWCSGLQACVSAVELAAHNILACCIPTPSNTQSGGAGLCGSICRPDPAGQRAALPAGTYRHVPPPSAVSTWPAAAATCVECALLPPLLPGITLCRGWGVQAPCMHRRGGAGQVPHRRSPHMREAPLASPSPILTAHLI